MKIFLQKFALLTIATIFLVAAQVANAQTKYVTDNFEVMLRTGPSMQNKIVRPMPSGTRVQLLRRDSGNGHSQVQISSGEIGYMLTRFLSDSPAARNRVTLLENQLAQLKSEPNELRSLLANSQEENRELIALNTDLAERTAESEVELTRIKDISGDVVKIANQNNKLESEVQHLLLQLDDIRIQNEALKDNSERVRNLLGIGVLLLGIFLGWVLSISGRRNRNSWGS